MNPENTGVVFGYKSVKKLGNPDGTLCCLSGFFFRGRKGFFFFTTRGIYFPDPMDAPLHVHGVGDSDQKSRFCKFFFTTRGIYFLDPMDAPRHVHGVGDSDQRSR